VYLVTFEFRMLFIHLFRFGQGQCCLNTVLLAKLYFKFVVRNVVTIGLEKSDVDPDALVLVLKTQGILHHAQIVRKDVSFCT